MAIGKIRRLLTAGVVVAVVAAGVVVTTATFCGDEVMTVGEVTTIRVGDAAVTVAVPSPTATVRSSTVTFRLEVQSEPTPLPPPLRRESGASSENESRDVVTSSPFCKASNSAPKSADSALDSPAGRITGYDSLKSRASDSPSCRKRGHVSFNEFHEHLP